MIRTLYYMCYYAYLKGSQEDTIKFFELLKHEFKEKGTRSSLTRDQLLELKKIKSALTTGFTQKNAWVVDPIYEATEVKNAPYQDKLVKIIDRKGIDSLRHILSESLFLDNLEHPCPPYGYVDMVYRDEDTIYPVEVKRGLAKHDILGQIAKYDLAFRFKLHYNLYSRVQPVTICGSYEPHTLEELKRSGVRTLQYSLADELFTIRET